MDKLRGTETRSDEEWKVYNELKTVNRAIKTLEVRRKKTQAEWSEYQKANRDTVQKSEHHFSSPRLDINESYKNRVIGAEGETEPLSGSDKTSKEHFLKRKDNDVTIVRDLEDESSPSKKAEEEPSISETSFEGEVEDVLETYSDKGPFGNMEVEKPIVKSKEEQAQQDIENIVENSNDEYEERKAQIEDRKQRERLAELEIEQMRKSKRAELEKAYSSAPEALSAEPEKPKDILEDLAPMFEVVRPTEEVPEEETLVEDGPSFETQEIERERSNSLERVALEFLEFQSENEILGRDSFDTDEDYEKYMADYIYDNFYSESEMGPKYSTQDQDHDKFMEGYKSVEAESRQWVKEMEEKNNDIWNTDSVWLYTKIKMGADNSRPMGRIYANFDPHGSVGFQLAVIEGLYEAGIRSDVKTPSSEMLEETMDNINRADKVVIYFNLDDSEKVKEVIEKAREEYMEYVVDAGPKFTEEVRRSDGEVLSGLHYGEEPVGQDGDSFGGVRTCLLYTSPSPRD